MQAKSKCPLVAKNLGSGILQWSTTGQVRWHGQQPHISDKIGISVFGAFQDWQVIGWDQALQGQLNKNWGILFCNPNFENTYNLLILFYTCT
jgi:hypothetical protein